jgi:acetolactate synthase-1/2/3 large subunit
MYSESFGARGHRVEKTEDFAPLLERCFDEGGVHLIDLQVDYSENTKVLVDELRQKVCLV